jgi:hypothetical protein
MKMDKHHFATITAIIKTESEEMAQQLNEAETGMMLMYDQDAGEGGVAVTAEFMAQDPLFRADVLKDWILVLTEIYSETDIFDNPVH